MLEEDQTMKNITQLFYNGQYEQGRKEISQLIEVDPENSMLLSNRALFNSQLGFNPEAVQDLNASLKINPLNYIAYFNLFSIQTLNNQDHEAYENLCCSLSCLHLIKAKKTKTIADADKALKYSKNNLQARVLKGLVLAQENQFQAALNQFNEAITVDPSNEVLYRLRSYAGSRANPENSDLFIGIDVSQFPAVDRKLKSSLTLTDDDDLIEQINKKVDEFNALYRQINDEAGAVTRKVPKESSISNNIETFIKDKSGISKSNQDEAIAIIEDGGMKTPVANSEVHPEPGGYFFNSSILMSQSSYIRTSKIRSQNVSEFHSILSQQHKPRPQDMKPGQIVSIMQPEQSHMNAFESILNIHGSEENQFESIITQNQKEEEIQENYNLIYPLDEHMKLKVTIISLRFIDKSEEWLRKLTDVYCLINYNSGSSKLKSMTKKCEGDICIWDEDFDLISISQDPSDMKVKIYNKKYNTFRDEFLGELEVLITTADRLKLPLYSKKGDFLGELLINLELVQDIPQPEPEEADAEQPQEE